MLPDDRTIVFAEGAVALEEIFGPDEAVCRPYVVPGQDRRVLLVWGARRGGPPFLDAKQWQVVREDHVVVWAERQPLQSIEAWPGYPGFVEFGMAPFAPILNYPPTALGVRLGNPARIHAAINGVGGGWNPPAVAQSLEAALKLAGAMGGMYRNPVEASPEPIRGHYVKLLDDYLDLLKKTTVAQEGEIVRTESTIDPAVVRNVLQLLAAQYREPNTAEGADSSKESDALSPEQVVQQQPKGKVTVQFRVAAVGLYGWSDEMLKELLQGTCLGG